MNKVIVENDNNEILAIIELVLNHPEAPLIITIVVLAILGWKALDLYKRR